jgi:hypothetical protein
VRQPELLASLVDPRSGTKPTASRQLSKIDLVLRLGGSLHLLELKKPSEHRQFRFAANEIERQWLAARRSLGLDAKTVHLWTVCPVRWSKRRRVARVPEDWEATLNSLANAHLQGDAAATLSAVFYTVFVSREGQLLVLWRGDTPPTMLAAISRQLEAA